MLILDLIAAHLVGDFILQTDDMARRKLTEWRVRLLHVCAYALPFFIVLAAQGQWETPRFFVFLLLLMLLHFITDSRRWASAEEWAPLPIIVDQTLHVVQLAVLGRLLV